MKPSDTNQMHQAFNLIEARLKALEQYKISVNDNHYLEEIVFQKFPIAIIHSLSNEETLTLATFRVKMDKLIKIRERYAYSSRTDANSNNKASTSSAQTINSDSKSSMPNEKAKTVPISTSKTTNSEAPNNNNARKCAFCAENHFSDQCTAYTTHVERKMRVKGKCFNCLNKHSDKCNRTKKCYFCKEQHHSSLCSVQYPDEKSKEKHNEKLNDLAKSTEKKSVNNLLIGKSGTHLTACARIRNPKTGASKYAHVFFDGGCPRSMIIDSVANALQLKRNGVQEIPVKGFLDQKPKQLHTSAVTVEFPDIERTITAYTTPKIADDITCIDHNEFLTQYPQYAHINFADEGNELLPHILIGGDYFFTFIANEQKITVGENLHIISSLLGWMIAGTTQQDKAETFLITTTSAIEQLTSLDVVGIRDAYLTQVEEEEEALKQFYEKIEFINDRYQVGWPWRMNP